VFEREGLCLVCSYSGENEITVSPSSQHLSDETDRQRIVPALLSAILDLSLEDIESIVFGLLPVEHLEEFQSHIERLQKSSGSEWGEFGEGRQVHECSRYLSPDLETLAEPAHRPSSVDFVLLSRDNPEYETLKKKVVDCLEGETTVDAETVDSYSANSKHLVPPIVALCKETGNVLGYIHQDWDDLSFGALFVLPEARGKGLGSALLGEAAWQKKLRGDHRFAVTHVDTDNEASQATHAKAGWSADPGGLVGWLQYDRKNKEGDDSV